ncbi:MAG: integrase/recombinase XerD [Pseudonocardiales bacterium]|nr:integrase/recombinase XerD [Pseudonocardiales bacterium]
MSRSVAGRAELEAARLLLDRMGVCPADLLQVRPTRALAPTFAEYVPVVAAAVSPGTRRAYGSYWNRVVRAWGDRRIDEPHPTEIEQLRAQVQANVLARRNARGGRSAAEHLVAALRCLYRRAVADGYLDAADNPALKVDKPRRLPSTRRACRSTLSSHISQASLLPYTVATARMRGHWGADGARGTQRAQRWPRAAGSGWRRPGSAALA